MRQLLEKVNWITLVLCIGVIQVSAYYLVGATVRPDHCFAVAQPDSALYLQAARRIVEGFPFSYSAGEAVCTGTTSVLYPFVLAVPYALGFSGAASVAAAFVLNAAFYLMFLFCWARVIDLKVRNPIDKAIAGLALALFGQPALVALAQSDIGLWLLASAVFAWGLAANNPRLFVPALLAGPWVRPEGMVCAIAFALVAFVVRRRRGVAVLAILSVVGVFLLNHFLAGSCQFSSVQGKGHFAVEPFAQAALATWRDALAMVRQIFFSFSSGTVREMFFPPIVGGGLLLFHLFSRDYSDFDAREAVFLLACGGGFATVAASGWQGTNYDRYLAWTFPVVVIWTALGAAALGRRLRGAARSLPVVLVFAFFAYGSAAEVLLFRVGCEKTETDRAFYERCETALPPGASIGSFGNAASVHWMSPRRFAHLYGIYSLEFATKDVASAFEVLKRDPSSRFDFWICDLKADGSLVEPSSRDVFGKPVLLGPRGLSLNRADWCAFDAGAADPAPPAEGLSLRARVDVGYEPDERAAAYEPFGDYLERPPAPVFRFDDLGGRKVAEVGRVLRGGDEMTVCGLVPGRDLCVVMRSSASQRAVTLHATGSEAEDYSFSSPLELVVAIDGCEACRVRCELPDKGFGDVSFVIPGKFINQQKARVAFLGGHVAFAYWFFQQSCPDGHSQGPTSPPSSRLSLHRASHVEA